MSGMHSLVIRAYAIDFGTSVGVACEESERLSGEPELAFATRNHRHIRDNSPLPFRGTAIFSSGTRPFPWRVTDCGPANLPLRYPHLSVLSRLACPFRREKARQRIAFLQTPRCPEF